MREVSDGLKRPLFTNGDLCRLVVPLVLEQLLICSVGMADTMMLSFLGESRVAGVTLIDSLNTAIYYFFIALATGGAVVASQHLGGNRLAAARHSGSQLLGVNLFLGVLVTLLAELFCGGSIRLLFGDLEGEVYASAHLYFRITGLSYPFFAVYCSCAALLRSQNQSKLSLYASMLGNAVNIGGNALLIYGFGWGVSGAAWATVASRVVAMSLMLYLLSCRRHPIHLQWRGLWRPDFRCIRKILHIGIPSAVESGVFQFGRVLVVGVIAAFGATQLAANAVANNIGYLGSLCGNAYCLAAITVIGQAVGHGEESVVRFYVRKVMRWACGWQVAWNLVLFCLMPLFLSFYTLSDETCSLAVKLIVIHNGIGMFLYPWSFVLPEILRAMNDVRFMMFWGVASMLVCRVGLSYGIGGIHGLGLGAMGVWYAMVVDWVVRIIGGLWRYRSGRWRQLMRAA